MEVGGAGRDNLHAARRGHRCPGNAWAGESGLLMTIGACRAFTAHPLRFHRLHFPTLFPTAFGLARAFFVSLARRSFEHPGRPTLWTIPDNLKSVLHPKP